MNPIFYKKESENNAFLSFLIAQKYNLYFLKLITAKFQNIEDILTKEIIK